MVAESQIQRIATRVRGLADQFRSVAASLGQFDTRLSDHTAEADHLLRGTDQRQPIVDSLSVAVVAVRHAIEAMSTAAQQCDRWADEAVGGGGTSATVGATPAARAAPVSPRRARADQMLREAAISDAARTAPYARDVLPNLGAAEIDRRKFEAYSMNPDHPHNRGKADAWRALGYDVDNPAGRRKAASDVEQLVGQELLKDGKIVKATDSTFGRLYRVVNGFIGPNGRHGTLVTCWMVSPDGGSPRMTTSWVKVHKEKGNDQ